MYKFDLINFYIDVEVEKKINIKRIVFLIDYYFLRLVLRWGRNI